MWTLGLTGSIATGKSTVAAMFAELGVPVFSSDAAVHELYAGAAVAPVGALFPGVINNGKIDRDRLAAVVLGHPEKLKALESIVHPLVRARIAAFLEEAKSTGADVALVDIPLLFEGGQDWGFDRIIVTAAPLATIRERALARPGMTGEKLDAILARQVPQDDKISRADYVIHTDRPLADTRAEIVALVETLRAQPAPDR